MMTIVTVFSDWLLLKWMQIGRVGSSKSGNDAFFASLTAAPARKKPDELYRYMLSPAYAELDEQDHMTHLLNMVQSCIRPGMDEKEALNVQTRFFEAISKVALLQTNRLYGGQSDRKNTG